MFRLDAISIILKRLLGKSLDDNIYIQLTSGSGFVYDETIGALDISLCLFQMPTGNFMIVAQQVVSPEHV